MTILTAILLITTDLIQPLVLISQTENQVAPEHYSVTFVKNDFRPRATIGIIFEVFMDQWTRILLHFRAMHVNRNLY